jgi:hypothetical protein
VRARQIRKVIAHQLIGCEIAFNCGSDAISMMLAASQIAPISLA